MKKRSSNYFGRAALLCMLASASVSSVADIILHPGYLSGTFTIGDYNVNSVNISATGNGYSASKSVAGDTYTLTVEGGDWDYSVGANALVRPANASYPYTRLYFNNRSIQIPVGSTVTNDYSYGVGAPQAAATIRFEVNITGDAYNYWAGYGYALQNVDPSVGERTYSQSYTTSYSSTTGSWDMPVIPNDNVRVYARVRVDNRWYYFWWSADLRYENITPGQTLVVPLNIEHTVVEPPPPPPPPQYDYGSVQVNVDLTLNDPTAFRRHYVWGYGGRYIYENPGSALIDPVRTGTWTYRAQTWFDDYRTRLVWPYTGGDPVNDRVTVELDLTATKDFISQTGVLTGDLTFSGTLAGVDLNRYFYNYGASNFYNPATSLWERQVTYGGYAYQYKYMGNFDRSYRLFLQPGPWLPYRVSASSTDTSQGYSQGFSLNLYDYNHYYDGNYYDFGVPSHIEAGATTVQDRDYCTGSVVVRFKDQTGNTLSYPRFSVSGSQLTDTGKTALSASGSAYASVRNALQPVVEMHAPQGNYSLYSIRFQAADGTYLGFPGFPITFECGVRKGVPISGKPKIVVEQPPAYYITNGHTVIVSGTAADDTGIAGMTVNGNTVVTQPTGNPENEVSFSYELALADGTNTIVTTATDLDGNESFDERPVYVDRWGPTVAFVSPSEPLILTDTQTTVPLEVTASDQGYGFTLQVTVNGQPACEATGSGNEAAAEIISCSAVIGPFDYGVSTIEAIARDAAGNVASATTTITVNTTPVVDAGPDVSLECGYPLASSGSFIDPDPDTWTGTVDYGDGTGVQTLALNVDKTFALNHDYPGVGAYTVTVSITDDLAATGTDIAAVTVSDTTPPLVTAELVPYGNGDDFDDSDEGRFIVSFSASDSCSVIASTQAVLLVPGWATPIVVENGQLIEFEVEDEPYDVEVEWESEGGISILEIEASALTLQVTATDAEGNTAVAEAVPTGLTGDNDDYDEKD